MGVTPERYGAFARALHWTVVVLLVALIAGGKFAHGLEYGDPLKPTVVQVHRTIGLAMFVVMLVRLGWALVDARPAPLASLKRWELYLSKAVHYAFYFLLLAIPVIGHLYSGASVDDVRYLGFSLPSAAEFSREASDRLHHAHETMANVTGLLVALHVAGSLKHHYIDKTPIFGRMWR